MREHLDHFINGKIVPPKNGKYLDDQNPATLERIAGLADGGPEEIDMAVAAAKEAFPQWRDRRPIERGRILMNIASKIREKKAEITAMERLETGMPLVLAEFLVQAAAQYFEFYGGLVNAIQGETIDLGASLHAYTRREPFGVVGVITPWNAPLNQAARDGAAALCAGNTVVLKPSSFTSASTLELARLAYEECGMPAGVLNVVAGSGERAGEALVTHPDVRKVDFTGSVEAGRKVAIGAGNRIIPVTLELGGKSPDIIFSDADFEKAVAGAVRAFVLNAGQICSAGTRVLVEEEIHDKFVTAMVQSVKSMTVGADEKADIGPIITPTQYKKVQEYYEIARQEGAVAAIGGTLPEDPNLRRGWFVSPTIYTNVTNKMRIAREEIFGPVGVVMRFKGEDEAIRIANDTPYGLVAGIWTSNLSRAHRVAMQIEAGQININNWTASGVESPFGGYKMSGYGRVKGLEALHHFTQVKCVTINL